MLKKIVWASCLGLCLVLAFRCSYTPSEKRLKGNLRAYANMYGYIRYFHPSDEASEINWDSFGVYAVQEIMQAREPKELKLVLEELFLPIAPTAKIYFKKEQAPEVWEYPDIEGKLLVAHWHRGGATFDNETSSAKSYRSHRGRMTMEHSSTAYQMQTKSVKAGQEFRYQMKIKSKGEAHQVLARMMMLVNKNRKAIKLSQDEEDWQQIIYEDELEEDSDRLIFILRTNLYRKGQILIDDIRFELKDSLGEWQEFPIYNADFEQNEQSPEGWKTNDSGDSKTAVFVDSAKNNKQLCVYREELSQFDTFAPYGDTYTASLNEQLNCIFPLALLSEVKGKTLSGEANYPLEGLKEKMANSSSNLQAVQLADFILCWTMMQHFHPNSQAIDFDSKLSEGIDFLLEGCPEEDYTDFLRTIFKDLNDGYLGILSKNANKIGALPFNFDYVNKELIIGRTEDLSFQSGDKIIAINGRSVQELLEEQLLQSSGSPQRSLYKSLHKLTFGPTGEAVDLKVERAGETLSMQANYELKEGLVGHFDYPSYKELEGGIVYLNGQKIRAGEVQHYRKELQAAKGIILDLRSSHLIYSSLMSHFTADTLDRMAYLIPCYSYPDQNYIQWDTSAWEQDPLEPFIDAPLAVLSDRNSSGLSESGLYMVREHGLGQIFGQPSGGIVGNLNQFKLSSGHQFFWNGIKAIKLEDSGIAPDVLVEQNRRAYEQGEDLSFEAALKYLLEN